ncbi:MAG: YfhO family protein [Saprospiraceae bacterium]
MNPILKRILPHAAAILTFFVLTAIFFLPQLQGKVVQQSDNIQYLGMSQEVREYYEETGNSSLWTNSMFGGMPTYQINTNKAGNLTAQLDKVLRLGFNRPLGYFFVGMLSFYIFMAVLGVSPWLAVVGALAFGLTTNNFLLFEAGHNTKLLSIAYLPLIAAGILLAFRSKYLWGAIIFATGFALNLQANHVQMTYYLLLTLLILGIAQAIYSFKNGQLPSFGKAVGILLIGGLLGLGSSASNLWVSYEYSKDTMRGEPILTSEASAQNAGIQSSSETNGLSWDYAMQWSNGWLDVFAGVIPGIVGGGSQEPVQGDALKRDRNWNSVLNQTGGSAPLYWGSLPFTSGPIYFGAVIFLLFLMGLILVKGPVKWWLALGTLLTVFLSMGKNMEFINRLFFDFMPLFNKFRTPNSVLSVTAMLLPALGILGISNILKDKVSRAEALKALYIGGGIVAVIALFFAFIGPSMFDFSSAGDGRYKQAGFSLEPLMEARQTAMRNDSLRTLGLVLLAAGFIWAFLKDKISSTIMLAGLGLLTTIDLWTVGRRYLDNGDFVAARRMEAQFTPRPVDEQILKDPDLHYRVLDASTNPFQSSFASYFHKSLGGYHAAKLQRYQDVIDRHLNTNNQKVVNMLNTKYIIVPGQDGNPVINTNMNILGNAWLVTDFMKVADANAEIDALNTFEPRTQAVVHQEFNDYISGMTPQGNGNIKLNSYAPDVLTYDFSSNTDEFAVFSEIWYGPNKGWQTYIDDQPVDHIRVNYLLRGLKIPAGQHKIAFKFEPKTFYTGKTVSLISSLLIVGGLLGFTAFQGYNYFTNLPAEPAPSPQPAPAKKPAAKTQSKRRKKK